MTNSTLIELLKADRDFVINQHKRATIGLTDISLKDYMNLVIRYFDEHERTTKKSIKDAAKGDKNCFITQLCAACKWASKVASANTRRQFVREHYAERYGADTVRHQNYL